MTTTTADHEIQHRLSGLEIRYTSGRRLVVAALADSVGPQSAADLHSAVGDTVPLSSLYRTLAVLDEANVVSRHFGTDGVIRYELAEWLKGHHHHLICVRCGSVDDIVLTKTQERKVRRAIEEIATEAGFTPSDHTLEIEGTCGRCR